MAGGREPKKYRLVLFAEDRRGCEIEVKANSPEEAEDLAFDLADGEWDDPETLRMGVDSIEEIE